MPIVTDISPQKKRAGHYNIFVDGQFAFSVSDLQLSNLNLVIGNDYTTQQIVDLKSQVIISKSYSRALDYISRRRRSEWEVRDYLKRKEIDPTVISQVVDKLLANNYINDVEFAKAWVADRNLIKPRSKLQLQMELQKKGIDREIISEVIDSLDHSIELDNLVLIATKKLTRYRDKNKLITYLIRQGFSHQDVRSVVDRLMTENNELGSNTDNK